MFSAFGGTIAIFRPYKRNIHNLFDFLFMLVLAIVTGIGYYKYFINLLPSLIIFGVIVYWTIKKILMCCYSCKTNRKRNTPNDEEHEDTTS